MKNKIFTAVFIFVLWLAVLLPVGAAPTVITISIPLNFGGHTERASERLPSAAEVRAERRLRIARYAFQLADAIISAIGYRAYSKCLSCLAYPGGGPVGSVPMSVADVNGGRRAEVNPLVVPFSNGGIASLALGTLAYDLVDTQIERRWSVERRTAADIAEIGAHVWGISTWLPEIRAIHRNTAIASACGDQWRAKNYGEAFSVGCVNEYYRSGPTPKVPFNAGNVISVCAPTRFAHGTYLFTTPNDYIVASGTPCTNLHSPFP